MNQPLKEKLTDTLEQQDDIVLAFLYGSAAAGRETSQSDLDIATLHKGRPSREQVEAVKDELEKTSGKEVDLLLLNDASPIICMQVLKKGIPLIRRGSAYGRVLYPNRQRIRRSQVHKKGNRRKYSQRNDLCLTETSFLLKSPSSSVA